MAEHWEVINAGGIKIPDTPEHLWEQAVGYFKWCQDNPMVEKRTLLSGKTQGAKIDVEFVRPFTIKGFCLHAGISEKYISDLKDMHPSDSPWVHVMERILYLVYNQNLEGAIVGTYNPIIISKILNVDKDNDKDNDAPPRVEIVDSTSSVIPKSEDEALKNLDFGKVEILKEKTEELKRENSQRETNKDA